MPSRPRVDLTNALRRLLADARDGLLVKDAAATTRQAAGNVNACLAHLKSMGEADSIAYPGRHAYRRRRWFAPQHESTARIANARDATRDKLAATVASPSIAKALLKRKPGRGDPPNWTHDPRYQLDPAKAASFRGEFSRMGVGHYLDEDRDAARA